MDDLVQLLPKNDISKVSHNYIAFNSGYFYSKRCVNNFFLGKVVEHRWRKKGGGQYVLVGEHSPKEIVDWILKIKTTVHLDFNELFGDWLKKYKLRFSRTTYFEGPNIMRAADIPVVYGKGFVIWIVGGMKGSKKFWRVRIERSGGIEFKDFNHCPKEKEIEYLKIKEEIC